MQQEDSDSTEDDFSRDRPLMQRISAVFDYILGILPGAAKKDMRYKIISQMMRDGLIDLALIPDRIIAPMMRECGMALMFVADGDMEQLEILHERLNQLREQSERPEEDAGD